jgi:hypothetical protein
VSHIFNPPDLVHFRTAADIHHLKFQNKNTPFRFDGQINSAMIGDIQSNRGKIAVKDRGVVALILGYLIFSVPVVRDGSEK